MSDKPVGGVEPLRSLGRDDTIAFRRTLAALMLRFGPDDEVTKRWQDFAGALVEAVKVVTASAEKQEAASERLVPDPDAIRGR